MGYASSILILLFCFSLVFNMIGFSQGYVYLSSQFGTSNQSWIFNLFWSVIIGGLIFGTVSSLATGSFSVMYTIPAVFIGGLSGYFLQTLIEFSELPLPVEAKVVFFSIFGIGYMIAVVGFIRGDF